MNITENLVVPKREMEWAKVSMKSYQFALSLFKTLLHENITTTGDLQKWDTERTVL